MNCIPPKKIFIFGLDAAGKTSMVNAIKKIPNPGATKPSLKFEIDKLNIKDVQFVTWTAPGQTDYRKSWEKGFGDASILLFIIDTLDIKRYNEAMEELNEVLKHNETTNVPLILCYHKLDIPDAKTNLPLALATFSPDAFDDRPIHQIETTIFNPDSIVKLQDLFVTIAK